MKIKLYFFFLILLVTCQTAYAKIIEVSDLDLVTSELNENTLVIFDVDNTLIMGTEAVLQPHGESLFKKLILEILQPRSPEQNKDFLLSVLLREVKVKLIDPSSANIIQSLQEKGIKTIALTARKTGPFGVIPKMEDRRYWQLKRLNIDFSHSFSSVSTIQFPEFSDRDTVLYKQGIIYSGENGKVSKAEALSAFLREINWIPEKIVFIDDSLKHVETLQSAAAALGIDYLGLYYTAYRNHLLPLDEEIAKIQFNYLAEHHRWLTDDEAAKINSKNEGDYEKCDQVFNVVNCGMFNE